MFLLVINICKLLFCCRSSVGKVKFVLYASMQLIISITVKLQKELGKFCRDTSLHLPKPHLAHFVEDYSTIIVPNPQKVLTIGRTSFSMRRQCKVPDRNF